MTGRVFLIALVALFFVAACSRPPAVSTKPAPANKAVVKTKSPTPANEVVSKAKRLPKPQPPTPAPDFTLLPFTEICPNFRGKKGCSFDSVADIPFSEEFITDAKEWILLQEPASPIIIGEPKSARIWPARFLFVLTKAEYEAHPEASRRHFCSVSEEVEGLKIGDTLGVVIRVETGTLETGTFSKRRYALTNHRYAYLAFQSNGQNYITQYSHGVH